MTREIHTIRRNDIIGEVNKIGMSGITDLSGKVDGHSNEIDGMRIVFTTKETDSGRK